MISLYDFFSQPRFQTICISSHIFPCDNLGLEDIEIFAVCRSHGMTLKA